MGSGDVTTVFDTVVERGYNVAVKKFRGNSQVVGFRCPPDVLARVDKFAERSTKRLGVPVSRAMAILHFLERGLSAEGLGRKK